MGEASPVVLPARRRILRDFCEIVEVRSTGSAQGFFPEGLFFYVRKMSRRAFLLFFFLFFFFSIIGQVLSALSPDRESFLYKGLLLKTLK